MLGASGGGAAAAGAASVAGSSPGGAAATPLSPQVGAPSPVSDGRLPDLPETRVGEPAVGWDNCSPGLLTSRRECVACPAARGMDFLIAGAAPPDVPVEPGRPQFYFYFQEPQSSAALWVDFAWLSGPRSAQLSLWETNTLCDPQGEPQVFDLAPLLLGPSGAWSSACIPLDESHKLQGLGFRINTAGRVGIDAIRFGPPCRRS